MSDFIASEKVDREVDAPMDDVINAIEKLYGGEEISLNGEMQKIYSFIKEDEYYPNNISFYMGLKKNETKNMWIVLFNHGSKTLVSYHFATGNWTNGIVFDQINNTKKLNKYEPHMIALLKELNLDDEVSNLEKDVKSIKRSEWLYCCGVFIVLLIIVMLLGMMRGG